MAENPHPKWKQDACELCKQGVPMPIQGSQCTAPSEAQHIEQLTARVAELEKQDAKTREDFCTIVTQVRADLSREVALRRGLQAENARLRAALEAERKRCPFCKGTGSKLVRTGECSASIQEPCDMCGWIDAALSSTPVAEPQADPVRKALEELVRDIEPFAGRLYERGSSFDELRNAFLVALAAAREALKGGQ